MALPQPQFAAPPMPMPMPPPQAAAAFAPPVPAGYGGPAQPPPPGWQQPPPPPPAGWGPGAPGMPPVPVQTGATPDQIQRQVQQQANVAGVGPGGGTVFTESILVVNQKARFIEIANEYAIFDQGGRQIGSVVEVGQSALKKAARVLTSLDQYMTHRLEVRDMAGNVLLVLTRPAKLLKSRVIVARPDGTEIGQIVQQNAIGKIRFGLVVGGQQIGMIKAENWRAWNFAIVDHAEVEIARITKTWEGLVKAVFTTADNYVVQLKFQLPEPLLSLVVASALTVDTALKQDANGWN
jgi:hypothetical protein